MGMNRDVYSYLLKTYGRQPIPLEDMGAPSAFSGAYIKLALCEMGDNGTCIKKIMEFNLQ